MVVTIQPLHRVITDRAAYLAPRSTVQRQLPDSILLTTPSPHIITGDFNAHSMSGGQRTNIGGKWLLATALHPKLVVINVDSLTFFQGCWLAAA